LPVKGRRLPDAPNLQQHLNAPDETPEHDLRTHINVPDESPVVKIERRGP
jgi:hypothetical protein